MDKIAKAIIAAVTALGGALVTALSDGTVTTIEYVLVVVATITAGSAVWATTNAPKDEA
jgi:hypothetical protein